MVQLGNHALYAPSMAYTVGNVVFKTTNLVKNLFGKNFFKHVHIDTRMAYTEFAINSNKEFIHKNKPVLGIKPVIELLNDDIFLSGSYLTTNLFPMTFDNIGGGNFNFMPFFADRKAGNSAGYLLDRIRIGFGIFMNFNTVVEQMNMFSILTSMWTPEKQIPRQTAIEIHLPKPLLQMISVDSGIPMRDENGSVEKFLSYLNKHCGRPVTYQMKPSSGNDEFFMYYPLTIEYTPTDYSMESVEKLGQTIHSAPITFTLTAEFNTVQLFDYAPPRGKEMNLDAYEISVEDRINNGEGKFMVPICTFDNLFNERNDEGWRFFTTRMYKVDHEPGQTEDRLDLSELFKNTNIKEIIEYHNKYGIDNHIFFNIQVWGLDKQLKEGRDYDFDFKTLTLITKKLNRRITYRFVIYIDDGYINDLVVKLRPEEFIYR